MWMETVHASSFTTEAVRTPLRGLDSFEEHLQHELVDLVSVLPDFSLQRGARVQDLQQDRRLMVEPLLCLHVTGPGFRGLG